MLFRSLPGQADPALADPALADRLRQSMALYHRLPRPKAKRAKPQGAVPLPPRPPVPGPPGTAAPASPVGKKAARPEFGDFDR